MFVPELCNRVAVSTILCSLPTLSAFVSICGWLLLKILVLPAFLNKTPYCHAGRRGDLGKAKCHLLPHHLVLHTTLTWVHEKLHWRCASNWKELQCRQRNLKQEAKHGCFFSLRQKEKKIKHISQSPSLGTFQLLAYLSCFNIFHPTSFCRKAFLQFFTVLRKTSLPLKSLPPPTREIHKDKNSPSTFPKTNGSMHPFNLLKFNYILLLKKRVSNDNLVVQVMLPMFFLKSFVPKVKMRWGYELARLCW